MRSLLVAVTALVLIPAGLSAAEIRGTVKSVDASKNRLTLMVDGKERTVECTPKCKVTTMVESRRAFPRRTSVQEYLSSLNQLPTGAPVTVMLETTNGMEMATSIQATETSSGRTILGGGGRLFRGRR